MTAMKRHRPRGIASRIRTMMQIRDLSIETAAKSCRLPQKNMEAYAKGEAAPGRAAVFFLAYGLRCDMDWLDGKGARA